MADPLNPFDNINRLARGVEDVDKKLRNLEKGAKDAGGSTSRFGTAAIYAAQGLEDMNYGLQHGLNNFAQMAFMIGAPTGVLVGTQLLAAAGISVARNWEGIERVINPAMFRLAGEEVAKLNKRLDELKENARHDAESFMNLPNAEQQALRAARLEQVRRDAVLRQDPGDVARAQAMQGVFAGEDIEQMSRQIGGDMLANGRVNLPEPLRRKRAELEKMIKDGGRIVGGMRAPRWEKFSNDQMQHMQTELAKLQAAAEVQVTIQAQELMAGVLDGRNGAIKEFMQYLPDAAFQNPGVVPRRDLEAKMRRALRQHGERRVKEEAGAMLRGGLVEHAAGLAMPGAPPIAPAAMDEAASAMQGDMEALGLTGQEQARIANLFVANQQKQGPDKRNGRLALTNFIYNSMIAGGASAREIMQMLPDLIAEIEGGANKHSVVRRALMRLQNQGMRQGIARGRRGIRAIEQEAEAMAGAAVLGIAPNVPAFDQMSRLTPEGSALDKEQAKNTDALLILAQELQIANRLGVPIRLGRRGGVR